MKPPTPQQLAAAVAEILETLDTRLRDPAVLRRAILWQGDRPEAAIPPTRPFSNNSTK